MNRAVHFIGISGIGMSALARILLQRGYTVSGSSDRRTALTDRLAAEGARVAIGHDAAHLASGVTVVVSTAISHDNPELAAARERGLDIVHRGALLARLMHERRGIAIAGTHGKTTTTAMVASVLEAGGIDPSVVVGGERVDTGTNARDGAGAWLVTEADESDLSFLDLRPEIAVVTNIENDHVASDDELPALLAAFEAFLETLPPHGLALVGIDEPRGAALARAPRAARLRTFGFAAGADIRAENVAYAAFGSRFSLRIDGVPAGEFRLRVPGAINVADALPAIGIGLEFGLGAPAIAAALARFGGVRRRFEILTHGPRMTVVDDYAHHPTAVAATIRAARNDFEGPIVVAFQPHRYTRTKYLAHDFARALCGVERVVLTDVYAASERALPGVDATTIGAPLAALGGRVAYVRGPGDLTAYLLAEAPYGALVLLLGAGSITARGARPRASARAGPGGGRRMNVRDERLAPALRENDRDHLRALLGDRARFDEPLAPYTSWKIGGPADAFVVLENEAELADLLRLAFKRALPWFVLGSGSNLLVGDGGIRGLVIRLGGEFARIALDIGHADVVVHAGASAPMPLVVAQAASAGAGLDRLACGHSRQRRRGATHERRNRSRVRRVRTRRARADAGEARGACCIAAVLLSAYEPGGRRRRVAGEPCLRSAATRPPSARKRSGVSCGARRRSRCNSRTPVHASAIRPAIRPAASSKPSARRAGARVAPRCRNCTRISS